MPDPALAPVARQRAPKACARCRMRKVRCDATQKGTTCTNCYLDGLECHVVKSPRVSRPRATSHVTPTSKKRQISFSMPASSDDLHRSTSSTEDWRDFMSLESILSRSSTKGSNHVDLEPIRIQAQLTFPLQKKLRGPPPVLPRFIHPLPAHLDSDDIEYLQRKGAFDVPHISLRNELLRCYVQYVHPFLPLIDIIEFLTVIEKNSSSSTISLLLFSAVMFAATAYVEIDFLRQHGYSQRGPARYAFFQRVKVLCDMDYELDRTVIIQSILLMTCWYESPNAAKDVWHLLNMAIFHGRAIGLTQDPSSISFLSSKQKTLWKRIWWSYYMRVRLVSIALRQIPPINDSDVKLPMLELTDFDPGPIPNGVLSLLGPLPSIQDIAVRESLAKLCLCLAQLCIMVNEIINVQYITPTYRTRIGLGEEQATLSVPRTAVADPIAIVRCDHDLRRWFNMYSSELLISANSPLLFDATENEVIVAHRAILTGLYLSAVSVLHRPQAPLSDSDGVSIPELNAMSWRRIHETANHITKLYEFLHSHQLLFFLPNTSVICLIPASILYLLHIKNGDHDAQAIGRTNLRVCIQVLKQIDTYPPASSLCTTLETALEEIDMKQYSSGQLNADSTTKNGHPGKTRLIESETSIDSTVTEQEVGISYGVNNTLRNTTSESELGPLMSNASLAHDSIIEDGSSSLLQSFDVAGLDASISLTSLLALEGCGSFLNFANELELDGSF